MSDNSTPGSPVATKRPRPVISCFECRRKKLKCDRTQPCNQCIKIGRPSRCEYQAGQEPEVNPGWSTDTALKRRRIDSTPVDPEPEDSSTPQNGDTRVLVAQPPSKGVIEDLQDRVLKLERALLAQTGDSRLGAPPCNQVDMGAPPDRSANGTGLGPKTTKVSSQFEAARAFMEELQSPASDPDISRLQADLRSLNLALVLTTPKSHHSAIPTGSPGLDLPPFHICEKLAVLYFDNMEHCFRIMHWPQFQAQLKLLFSEGCGEHDCEFGFVPLLVGVLAMAQILGTHQECEAATSFRILQVPYALNFMQEFVDKSSDRQRYLLPVLHVKMLLLMCRWLSLGRIDDLFRLNGEILRDALIMKMDQDPSTLPRVGLFEGEIRRRTWMTIVESDLMLSILCKMPCMVPPYACEPPRNIDDAEIWPGIETLPPSRPMEQWSDGLCQYVLSHSYPHRLAACKRMDSDSQLRFEDVLQYTRFLEKALQELPPPLRFSYSGDQASETPPRLMARMELDISIRRPLMHLYSCFASAPNAADIQEEARTGFVQSCLMLTTFQDLFDPRFSELNVPRPEGYWDFFYNVYRHELGQAILGLCLEIQRLGATPPTAPPPLASSNGAARLPTYTRANMIHAVRDTLSPMKRRLTRPGANFKDLVYFHIVLMSVVPAQGDLTRRQLILQTLQDMVAECRHQIERQGLSIPSADAAYDEPVHATTLAGPNFDPSWSDFPDLELLNPLD